MSDPPARDPKRAEQAPPNPAEPARPALSSNLQYLMKQPSTPWMTFDRDNPAEKTVGSGVAAADALDGGWGEENAAPTALAPRRGFSPSPPTPLAFPPPAPSSPPSNSPSASDASDASPLANVPPPPAHMMAVVDEFLSQSRPPPADPGPAGSGPRPVVTAAPSAPVVAPDPALEPPQDRAPQNLAPPIDATPPAASSFTPEDPSTELVPPMKKGAPIVLYAAIGGVLVVILAVAGIAFFVARAPAASTFKPNPFGSAISVVSAVSASAHSSLAPPDNSTAPPSSAVTQAPDAPASASATPTALSASSSASASAAASPPASTSSNHAKPNPKRPSYLTIPRAVAAHNIFLDGKLMLGHGARAFPVKCGEHTLAIDDRKATRVINIECGGEYIVTN